MCLLKCSYCLIFPQLLVLEKLSAADLSFHLSENMECAQLSIKEETEDETKYGSSGLHPDTGVPGEASTKVNVRQIRSISFQILI